MTREERAREALVEAIAFTNEGWVECPPERIVDLLVAFADAEAAAMRERAAGVCEEQAKDFLSPKYATGQPLSSFSERFACGQCAEAIRNLPTTGEE